jgi:CubicO group peptidase (beta-lactamase class C family)
MYDTGKQETIMKKQFRMLVIAILIAIAASASAFTQITGSEVDLLVEDAVKKFGVAGVSVGIVKDGKIIHSKGYGVKSIETKVKVDKDTQFGIGSNTKAFTTTALSILVDEGKLKWTDKVKDHIPEFKMYNAYVTENFNIQDLLTHRSGLGLGIGDLMFFPDGSDFTTADILSAFQHFKPQSAFRTKFDYDNLLYIVAGEVIARVSGMSWEDFVKTRILVPLKMDNSYTNTNRIKDKSNLSAPHSDETGTLGTISHYELDPKKLNGAAGFIYSSADDMNRWMLVHLNKGKYGEKLDKQLFSPTAQSEMWRIHTVLPANPNPRYKSNFAGYGLGWGLTDVTGKMEVSHTGGLPGMLSRVVMIPELNLGVVVLTNTSNGGGGLFTAVSRTIIDSYLGLDDFGWTDKYVAALKQNQSKGDEVTAKVWEIVKTAKSDHIKATDYIGIYEDKWFGKVEVFEKNDQLWFRSHRSPKLNGQMHFYKANSFAIKWEYQDMNADAFAIFSLDEEGKAQSIKMKGISPNIDFSFDFQDLDLQRVKK